MGKPLNPNDGRLKANRDTRRAQIEAIKRKGIPVNAEPLYRARRDRSFQAFLRALIRSAMA